MNSYTARHRYSAHISKHKQAIQKQKPSYINNWGWVELEAKLGLDIAKLNRSHKNRNNWDILTSFQAVKEKMTQKQYKQLEAKLGLDIAKLNRSHKNRNNWDILTSFQAVREKLNQKYQILLIS